MSDPADYIKAWGVVRTAAQWAKAPQCRVDEAELRRRIREGIEPEAAITMPPVSAKSPRATEPTSLAKTPFAERPAELPAKPLRRKISKYRGVSKREGQWYAQIRLADGVKFLGTFASEMLAAMAYDNAARPLGKKLNFPGAKPDAGAR